MGKTALIIGATGLIGKALVNELLAQDAIAKVITLTRRGMALDDERFENHQVDFSNLTAYTEYFQQADLLFSCLGTTKKEAGSIKQQRVVDLDYQYQAAEIAHGAGVDHYFLVSSSGASASSISPYLKMKGELENKVTALGFKHCVIFQPSLLLGEREHQRPGEFLAGKVMPLFAYIPLLKRFRPIRGSDVAKKMAHVAMNNEVASLVLQSSVVFYSLEDIFG